ncbi:leukocyte receptor cluster member 9-like [Portunus trituberculatus]|uniref:leukocyte receptor cluster member 9-like n=1 Tax=Portunus trituberculatus TaxID=210409 RepID=UPI001E1CB182|nr:leukocyte receptor cluster member 9-like [Portunus trituberculatus]
MSCTATEVETSLVGTEMSEVLTPPDAKTICSFYLEGRCRFGEQCHNVHPAGVVPSRIIKPKRVVKSERQETDEKKPPLRTAGDVRKRIQWDVDLPKEHFTIGYLDRFTGVVEKPFTAFTWEHLSMVDLDQLAIPQHRIQYYKYKNVKVWDKSERLDLVFGSAGGNTTIGEVIQRVEDELAKHTCVSDEDCE